MRLGGVVDCYRATRRPSSEPGSRVKPPKWRTLRPGIFGRTDDFFNVPYPRGLKTISLLPDFTAALMRRGYSRNQVMGIMGHNWLRVFRAATAGN